MNINVSTLKYKYSIKSLPEPAVWVATVACVLVTMCIAFEFKHEASSGVLWRL